MTEKRDARGTLRDYARESERELLSICSSFFKGFKVLSVTFPAASLFEPDGDSPRGGFSPLDKANSTYPTFPVPTAKCFGVMTVFFWCDKTKILSSIIEPISVDVVDESPAVFWFPYNVVMDKIVAKPGITIVAFVEFYTNELIFINIPIESCIAYQIMPHIIQRCFYYIPFKYGIVENPVIINWWQSCLAPIFLPIIVEPTKTLGKVWSIAPLDATFHTYIISKNNKVSRRING